MNLTNAKPLFLPLEIVQMLRGQRGYTESSESVAEAARIYYQDGKDGAPFQLEPIPPGMFSALAVEWGDQFLRACWEQGRRDAGEEAAV